MNKERAVTAVRAVLSAALDAALAGAESARDEATHGESRAENKYDTRGLEASYLAAGQAERVLELRAALAALEARGGERVGVGSLVRTDGGAWYLVAQGAGGVRVELDGHTVSVLSPDAPLGRALLGCEPGDEVEVSGRVVGVDVVR